MGKVLGDMDLWINNSLDIQLNSNWFFINYIIKAKSHAMASVLHIFTNLMTYSRLPLHYWFTKTYELGKPNYTVQFIKLLQVLFYPKWIPPVPFSERTRCLTQHSASGKPKCLPNTVDCFIFNSNFFTNARPQTLPICLWICFHWFPV